MPWYDYWKGSEVEQAAMHCFLFLTYLRLTGFGFGDLLVFSRFSQFSTWAIACYCQWLLFCF